MNRRAFLIIIAGVMLAVGGALYDTYAPPPIPEKAKPAPLPSPVEFTQEGKAAPDFAFTTITGEQMQLHDFAGKVVLLNFWATWCPTCVHEFPAMVELAQRHKNKLVLLAVSNDNERSAIDKFIDRQKPKTKKLLNTAPVHIVHDGDLAITFDLFFVQRYPETIVMNPQGQMVRKIIGEVDWLSPEIEGYLENIFN